MDDSLGLASSLSLLPLLPLFIHLNVPGDGEARGASGRTLCSLRLDQHELQLIPGSYREVAVHLWAGRRK
jgi:hypothetical protein